MSDLADLGRRVELARILGWTVTDGSATTRVVWFSRGREYVHAGVDADGTLITLYGGVRGRAQKHWVTGRNLAGEVPDRLARLEEALRAEPFDTIDMKASTNDD